MSTKLTEKRVIVESFYHKSISNLKLLLSKILFKIWKLFFPLSIMHTFTIIFFLYLLMSARVCVFIYIYNISYIH